MNASAPARLNPLREIGQSDLIECALDLVFECEQGKLSEEDCDIALAELKGLTPAESLDAIAFADEQQLPVAVAEQHRQQQKYGDVISAYEVVVVPFLAANPRLEKVALHERLREINCAIELCVRDSEDAASDDWSSADADRVAEISRTAGALVSPVWRAIDV